MILIPSERWHWHSSSLGEECACACACVVTGMQTADHCKVLRAGWLTGFSPHHSSSAQEKTQNLLCKSLTLIPTNNVTSGRCVRCLKSLLLSVLSVHSFQSGHSRLRARIPVWDAAMSRGKCPRVTSCGPFWILPVVILALNVIDVKAYSCYEVRTAFQLRQVGPLHRVPETPGTGEVAQTLRKKRPLVESPPFDRWRWRWRRCRSMCFTCSEHKPMFFGSCQKRTCVPLRTDSPGARWAVWGSLESFKRCILNASPEKLRSELISWSWMWVVRQKLMLSQASKW